MQLQTTIPIIRAPFFIEIKTRIMLMGSCFADNIGETLKALRFHTTINPFGTVYNPISLAKNIDYLLGEKKWSPKSLVFSQEMWHSFDHHSRFSNVDKAKITTEIKRTIETSKQDFQKAEIISLTLGTAWVHRHIETKAIVANCHKIPAQNFEKQLLSVDEVVKTLSEIFEKIDKSKKILLTISPVRHWKEGAVENQLSKATLILAVDILRKRFGERISYFPAYEIMMDELRDYRFYTKDMLHPNELAIQYIWEKFSAMYFTVQTKYLIAQIHELNMLKAHRPFSTETQSYAQLQAKMEEMEAAILRFFQ